MALLFPLLFIFMSPAIIIFAAAKGILNGSAIIFGFLLLSSVLSSRLFCGWLCPGGAIQDQVAGANDKPWNSKWKNASKYIIWVLWFSTVVVLWVLHRPLKTDIFYFTSVDISIIISYFMVVAIIFMFTLFTGRRGMCHSFCWMAPFMVIGEKIADLLHIPRFRLKADISSCISCGQCVKKCPMSLNVMELVKSGNMDSAECISCLQCVDICPKKVISCGIRSRK